jgi:hypothetical protein
LRAIQGRCGRNRIRREKTTEELVAEETITGQDQK